MEKKVRNIVVDNKKYVYWYHAGEVSTVIMVSPEGDKTIRVSYEFENPDREPSAELGPYFWRMSKVAAIKNQERVEIALLMPAFIAELIRTTIKKAPDIFAIRNQLTTYKNAYSFLEDMGYEEIRPMWEVSLGYLTDGE